MTELRAGMADLLLVEDDEDLASLIELFLTCQGHTVRVARNGEHALTHLEERLPELVITDVDMPLLTGPAMAERMFVENRGKEKVPIIIVSGSEGLSDIAARVGTPYYLAKPFLPETLLALLVRALEERELPRPPLSAQQ